MDSSILNLLPEEPLILFIDVSPYDYYLQNVITGETRTVFTYDPGKPHEDNRSYEFVTWSRDGCEMIVWDQKVQRVDLDGNVLQDLFSFGDLAPMIIEVVVTPDEDRIAYHAVGRFYTPGVGYSGQFLEVVDLEHPTKVYRLSESNSGDGMLAWSPNGQWLGYAEYDDSIVQQVYIARFDGTGRRQITRFTDPKANLESLQWSQDGSRIAFLYDENVDDPYYSLMVAALQNQEPMVETVDIQDYKFEPYSFWWQNESTLTVLGQHGIYWLDIVTDRVVDTLLDSDGPGAMRRPQPFGGSTLIGFFLSGFDHFYIFDASSRRFSLMPYVHMDFPHNLIEKWVPLPATFPGEAKCSQ